MRPEPSTHLMLLLLKDIPDSLVGMVERSHRGGADVGMQRVRDELQVSTERQ